MDKDARRLWDEAAETFDEEADHGLRADAVREAWASLLARWLPSRPARVLDAGCGTGSLSVLMAEMGHTVTGIDFSRVMLGLARDKARKKGLPIDFVVMDAAAVGFAPGSFDVVVCRHVLWALPDWPQALRRWTALLRKGGRVLLIEGAWGTGSGLRAQELLAALPDSVTPVAVERLDGVADYWGKVVRDERYLVVGDIVS